MKTEDATTTLILDIETGPGEQPSIDDMKVPANYTNPETIQKHKEANLEKAWRSQSLSSVAGEVFCIGVKLWDGPTEVIVGADERETMEMFDIYLHGLSYPKVIAHHGKTFDFPFLFHRALKYRMKTTVNIFSGTGGSRLVDTNKIMAGTDYRAMLSLDNMSKVLLGKSAKGEITGAYVFDLIQQKRGDDIINYCAEDIDALYECCVVLDSMGLLST